MPPRIPKPTTARGKAWRALAEGAPELLDDVDFSKLRHRVRITKKPDQAERHSVQRPLVTYLRRHLPAGSVVFAITNHARSREQVFALLADGMQPGMPDVGVVLAGARLLLIECKRPDGGSLSDAQKHTQGLLEALGVPVLKECRSKEEAVAWLREQGVFVR